MYISIVTVFLLLILTPLVIALKQNKKGKSGKSALIANIVMFFVFGVCFMIAFPIVSNAESVTEVVSGAANFSVGTGLAYLAAALSTGLACIGAGIAVASAASAAIGASSENPAMFSKSLIFVALAEGIALYGMLISFQIIGNL